MGVGIIIAAGLVLSSPAEILLVGAGTVELAAIQKLEKRLADKPEFKIVLSSAPHRVSKTQKKRKRRRPKTPFLNLKSLHRQLSQSGADALIALELKTRRRRAQLRIVVFIKGQRAAFKDDVKTLGKKRSRLPSIVSSLQNEVLALKEFLNIDEPDDEEVSENRAPAELAAQGKASVEDPTSADSNDLQLSAIPPPPVNSVIEKSLAKKEVVDPLPVVPTKAVLPQRLSASPQTTDDPDLRPASESFTLTASGGIISRDFRFIQPTSANLRNHSLPAAPSVGLRAEIVPFADAEVNLLRHLAWHGEAHFSILAQTLFQGDEAAATTATNIRDWSGGLVLANLLSGLWPSLRLDLSAGIGQDRITFALADRNPRLAEIPAATYTHSAISINLGFEVGRLSLFASAKALRVFDGGSLTQTQLPGAKIGGYGVGAIMRFRISPNLSVVAQGRYRLFEARALDTEAAPGTEEFVAVGSRDQLLGLFAGLRFSPGIH